MTDRYVYSGAAGAGTGADWANAYTSLVTAKTNTAAGDRVLVANDHSEDYTAAGMGLNWAGTAAAPTTILCVSRTGSVPPVSADLATTAVFDNSFAANTGIYGNIYCYGLIITGNKGQTGNNLFNLAGGDTKAAYEKCVFKLGTTYGGGTINFGYSGTSGQADCIDCQFGFAATGHSISTTFGSFRIRNTDPTLSILAAGSSVPTTLFKTPNYASHLVENVDLSAISGTLVSLGSGTDGRCGTFKFINCKLHASVTVASGYGARNNSRVEVIGCHSTTNVARNEVYSYEGTMTTETTIKRTAGASDGTTAYSWKIVTTANAKRAFPFVSLEGAVWNTTTGSSKTLTVHIVTDNVTLTDAEIWLEVDYLGTSAAPVATRISDSNADILATAANQATSTEAWTTTGLGTPVYQKLECTFTPQMVGPIRWRVKCGKASATVYVCPKAELA